MTTQMILASKYAYVTNVHSGTKTIEVITSEDKKIDSWAVYYGLFENAIITRDDHFISIEGIRIKVRDLTSDWSDRITVEEAQKIGLIFCPDDIETIGFFRKRNVLKKDYYEEKERTKVKIESTLPYTIIYIPEKK